MAVAGTFVAVLGGGEWNEVFLLQPTMPGGMHWICATADSEGDLIISAVVLQQGAVVAATDAGPARTYPGLTDGQVWWMIDKSVEGMENVWVPNEDYTNRFRVAVAPMQTWPAIPEASYFQAGGQTNTFPDMAKLAAALQSSDALQPGRFAMIFRGASWHEVLLVAVSGNDKSQWLCSTTNYNLDKIWTAVRFVPGSYLVAEDSSSKRSYVGILDGSAQWIMVGSGEDAWSPSPDVMEQLFAEAKLVASQLGTIPQEMYCVSGGLQNCIPSIQDMLRGNIQPSPGKFVLIDQDGCLWKWVEALLCVASPNGNQWLCLSTDSDDAGGASKYIWTVVTLVEGHYHVLADIGCNRCDSAYMASAITPMCKVPEKSMWLPTPQRIRKAISDATKVMNQVQSGELKLEESTSSTNLLPRLT